MKSERELILESNAALRRGFHLVDQTWRLYARIEHVTSFAAESRCVDGVYFDTTGTSTLATYAKMLSLSKSEVESGEHIGRLVKMGRGAAQKFNDVFWGEVHGRGGPSWSKELMRLNESGRLDDVMRKIAVTVTFLNGAERPMIDATQERDGMIEFRGYFDFGVKATNRIVVPCTVTA